MIRIRKPGYAAVAAGLIDTIESRQFSRHFSEGPVSAAGFRLPKTRAPMMLIS
jgi:hypothetical protein